jgi:hypothetical protein
MVWFLAGLLTFLDPFSALSHQKHRKHGRWKLRQAFPSALMILSCLQIPASVEPLLRTVPVSSKPVRHKFVMSTNRLKSPSPRSQAIQFAEECRDYESFLHGMRVHHRIAHQVDPDLDWYDDPMYDFQRLSVFGRFADQRLFPECDDSFESTQLRLCRESIEYATLWQEDRQRLFDSAMSHKIQRDSIDRVTNSTNIFDDFAFPGKAQEDPPELDLASSATTSSPQMCVNSNDILFTHKSDPYLHFDHLRPSLVRLHPCVMEPGLLDRVVTAYSVDIGPSEPDTVRETPSTDRQVIPIIMDTGASFAVTMSESDFVGPLVRGDFGQAIGINGTSKLTGRGVVKYEVFTPSGEVHWITTPAYLMPDLKQRLFSPQEYCAYHALPYTDDDWQYGGNSSSFCFMSEHREAIRIPIDASSRLPILLGHKTASASGPSCNCRNCSACVHGDGRAMVPGTGRAPIPPGDGRALSDATNHYNPSFHLNVLDSANSNLTSTQKLLLLDHQRLGHIEFQHLQQLYRDRPGVPDFDGSPSDDVVPSCLRVSTPSLSSCDLPLCQACQFAKQRRRSSGAKHSTPDAATTGSLSFEVKNVGDLISCDHYESAVRGRLLTSKGRARGSSRFCGGTLFFDHASHSIYCYHQTTLGGTDTLKSKLAFEQELHSLGHSVKRFRVDNGIFTSKTWLEHLRGRSQTQAASGVGAHHMNGSAERAIGTVTRMARAMLMHLQLHWPDEYDTSLWPMALSYACFLYNNTPMKGQHVSPSELLTGMRQNCTYLRRARVFGCPVYVLDPSLQDGKKVPKWKPRSRRGLFLGFSPDHSTKVALVLNLQTGHISPQFHVLFDEKFTTVPSDLGAPEPDLASTIQDLWRLRSETKDNILDDAFDPAVDGNRSDVELDDDWLTSAERLAKDDRLRARLRELPAPAPVHPSSSDPPPLAARADDDLVIDLTDEADDEDTIPDLAIPPVPLDPVPPVTPAADAVPPLPAVDDAVPPLPAAAAPARPMSPPARRGRPPRARRLPVRFKDFVVGTALLQPAASLAHDPLTLQARPDDGFTPVNARFQSKDALALHMVDWQATADPVIEAHVEQLMQMSTCPFTQELYSLHPLLFKTQLDSLDSPSYRQVTALKRTDPAEWEKWRDAMHKELLTLHANGTYHVVQRSLARSKDKPVIPCTWVLKRKRNASGEITKYKARICLRGDIQARMMDTGDTFAPVASWDTIRLVFSLAVQHKLKSVQIDFDSAFCQSTRDEPIYMQIPPGAAADPSSQCLEVYKSIYGDATSPAMWYDHLTTGLKSLGFAPSAHDPCLFVKDKCIVVFWVDDVIAVSPDENELQRLVDGLKSKGYGLGIESAHGATMEAFLGIKIDPQADGTVHLSQPYLIARILDCLGLRDSNPVATPATGILHHHEDSPEFDGLDFNYRSVLGMLNYVGNNTRPDCALAIHQCARFSHKPRAAHAQAVKRLGRYLKGTANMGFIMRKSDHVRLDCWVDADYAGLWNPDTPNVASNLRSRTGFLLTLGDTPVLWCSRLQSEISLSTMESELIAMSTAMKSLIPLRANYKFIATALSLPYDPLTKVFEDNQACIALVTANPPRFTPRAKHIAVKYFWFRRHLSETLIVEYVASTLQRGDCFTKPLLPDPFVKTRTMVCGWTVPFA